jgi:peptide deformylase
MATLTIVRLGHPSLRTPAQAVSKQDIGTPQLERLIDDLVETMRGAGSVGLSAPQIGIGQQIFVYEIPDHPEVPGDAVPLKVILNPMLVAQPGRMVHDWEGCTSVPDLRGLVPRHPAVRIRGLDRHGDAVDYVASGLEGRIIQHEYDHLNGMVFLDRMRDLRSLAFSAEWQEYLAGEGENVEFSAVV